MEVSNQKNNKNLELSQNKSENQIRTSELSQSVALAFERTNTLPKNIDGMVKDIIEEFGNLETNQIQLAIKKGSLGHYGKTFGDVSTQEICIWIRKAYPKPFKYVR